MKNATKKSIQKNGETGKTNMCPFTVNFEHELKYSGYYGPDNQFVILGTFRTQTAALDDADRLNRSIGY